MASNQLISSFAAGPYFTQNTGRQSMMDRNNGAMESVVERSTNPDGSMNMQNRLDAMKPYFGVPQRAVEEQRYAWWETENYDLPDAFKGKNPYVLNIIITAILTSDMWPVTEMLPYKKNEVGMKISWDQWIFSDSMLDRTPEESPSRMTTNTMTSYGAYLVRRGKAFILEHGFWNTPMGQKNWAMNIIQIVNATTETACFGATHAIFTAQTYVDANERFGNRRERGMVDVDSIMMEQTDSFARVQKEEGGLNTVLRKMDETFRNRNGHEANYVVLPSGCEIAVRNRPENNYAIYNGQGVINPGIQGGYGWTTRVSRGYRIGEHSPNVDPHFSTVCVGGFHVLTNQAANLVPIAEYRTQHRTILIFSMSKDDFAPMELSHVIGHLGLYENWNDENDGGLSHIGHAFFAKYMTWGRLLDRAGEKNNVVEKLALLSDVGYEEFVTKFNVEEENLISGENANFTQPTTAACHGSDLTTTQLSELDRDIARIVADTDSGDFIAFAGCTTIALRDEGGIVGRYTSNDASTWFALASRCLLLFDIPYFGADVITGVAKITTDSKGVTKKLQGIKQRGCARVLLSIAVSIVVSMIDYQLNLVNGNHEQAATHSYLALYEWMKCTDDCSDLISPELKLQNLFASDKFDSLAGWSGLSQFKHQKTIDFARVVRFIQRVASNELDPLTGVVAFKQLLQLRTPGGDQPINVGAAAFDGHLINDSLDPITAAVNAVRFTGDAKFKADKEKSLFEFLRRIKLASETELITLAKLVPADKAASNKHLAGYRIRFNALLRALTDIWMTSAPGTTDFWWVRILMSVSRFGDTMTAAYFLRDILAKSTRLSIASLNNDIACTKVGDDVVINASVETYIKENTANKRRPVLVASQSKMATSRNEHTINLMSQIRLNAILHADEDQYDKTNSSTLSALIKGNNAEWVNAIGKLDNDVDAKTYYTFIKATDDAITAGTETVIKARDVSIGDELIALVEMLATAMLQNLDTVQMKKKAKLAQDFLHAFSHLGLLLTPTPIEMNKVKSYTENAMIHIVQLFLSSYAMYRYNPACRSGDQSDVQQCAEFVYDMLAEFSNGTTHSIHLPLRNELSNLIFGVRGNPTAWWKPKVVVAHYAVGPGVPVSPEKKQRISGTAMVRLLDTIPLTKCDWLKYSLTHDIPVPLGAIGFRLHKQFDMGSAFMMDARGQAGYTYFGFADFQLGDDIGKKIHVAHFTVYLKSVIQQPKLIVFARYIISRGYFGGEGTRIYDPLEPDDVEDFRSGRVNKDILYAPVLSNYRAEYNVIDVTGTFPPSLCATPNANASTMYESADIMRRVWHLNHGKNSNIESGCSQPLHQTLAMQEHTQTWNNQRKGFTDVTLDKGHWGKDRYPGCGAIYRGDGRYLHRTIHDQTKTMTIGV